MPQLLTKKMKDDLVQERKDLVEEEAQLKIEASRVRRRRAEIKERLEEIKSAAHQSFLAESHKLRKKANTISEYLEGVRKLWNQLPKNLTYPRVKAFHWGGARNVGFCSNSHDCPLDGVTNWGAKGTDKPSGYIGIHSEFLTEFDGSDALRGDYTHPFDDWHDDLCVHTGTGGSRHNSKDGNVQLGWSTTIFLQDFPCIWKKLEPISDSILLVRPSLETFEKWLLLNEEEYPRYLSGNDDLATLCKLALEKGV